MIEEIGFARIINSVKGFKGVISRGGYTVQEGAEGWKGP